MACPPRGGLLLRSSCHGLPGVRRDLQLGVPRRSGCDNLAKWNLWIFYQMLQAIASLPMKRRHGLEQGATERIRSRARLWWNRAGAWSGWWPGTESNRRHGDFQELYQLPRGTTQIGRCNKNNVLHSFRIAPGRSKPQLTAGFREPQGSHKLG